MVDIIQGIALIVVFLVCKSKIQKLEKLVKDLIDLLIKDGTI